MKMNWQYIGKLKMALQHANNEIESLQNQHVNKKRGSPDQNSRHGRGKPEINEENPGAASILEDLRRLWGVN